MASILVFGPHPDDQELGMGGTILKLLEQGHRVHLVDMTTGEPTPHGSEEIRAREKAEAARALGVERTLVGLPNRQVVHSIEALHKVAAIIRRHNADWLFTPFGIDAHPDHVAASKLVEEARFWSKLSKSDIPGEPFHPARILYYFSVHLRIVERPSLVLDVTDEMDAKLSAMRAYRSQLVDNQPQGRPSVVDSVRDRARFWGHMVGVGFAEPFASREPVGLRGFDDLLL